jgi:hypothetical protein
MENSETCPKLEKCPIFREGVLMNSITGDSYKNVYCLRKRHLECKRFIVSKSYTKPIPTQVLPNSFMSIEEIIKRLKDGYWEK